VPDAKFARRLEDVDKIAADARQPDDIGARRLRLQQQRGEIGSADGVAYRSHDRAARGLDDLRCIALQGCAERDVDGDEEPRLAAALG
jgi:hypothetical protein